MGASSWQAPRMTSPPTSGSRRPISGSEPGGTMRIDRKRLEESMEALGRIGATARGGLNRVALTHDGGSGRDLLVSWMREAGLTVTVDRMGNIFGQRAGEDGLPPVMMGSHADSVPTGGRYDGQLGVLCALETIRTLNDGKIQTRHPVAMAIFTNEEGARFQPAMIGSGVLAGERPPAGAHNTPDPAPRPPGR